MIKSPEYTVSFSAIDEWEIYCFLSIVLKTKRNKSQKKTAIITSITENQLDWKQSPKIRQNRKKNDHHNHHYGKSIENHLVWKWKTNPFAETINGDNSRTSSSNLPLHYTLYSIATHHWLLLWCNKASYGIHLSSKYPLTAEKTINKKLQIFCFHEPSDMKWASCLIHMYDVRDVVMCGVLCVMLLCMQCILDKGQLYMGWIQALWLYLGGGGGGGVRWVGEGWGGGVSICLSVLWRDSDQHNTMH